MIDLGYVGSRGDHLLRYVDINRPQAAVRRRPAVPEHGATVPGLRRDPHARDDGQEPLSRDGGQLSSRGRPGSATVNYTLSRNKADATYDNSMIDDPQNPFDKDAEYASAGTDRTHIFTASYVYSCHWPARTREDGERACWEDGRSPESPGSSRVRRRDNE